MTLAEQLFNAYRTSMGTARVPEWSQLTDEHRVSWEAVAAVATVPGQPHIGVDLYDPKTYAANIPAQVRREPDDRVVTRTHPSEVMEHLGLAHSRCERLIHDAEKRGDQKGADAWLEARRAIEAAESWISVARNRQDWSKRPTK